MKTPKLLKTTASTFGLARKTTDADAIEAAIAEARTMIAEGEREEAEAQARYRDALLADDGDPAAALAEVQAAKIQRDRGEAQVAELTTRLASVREDQEQAGRRARYRDAQARAEAAKQALVQDYPDIARRVHALLRTLAEAEIAVVSANAELPEGVAPIPSPEGAVRDAARLPLDTAPIEVELWRMVGNLEPLPDADQARVKPDRGSVLHGTLDHNGRSIPCVRVTYRRDVLPSRDDDAILPALAATINLPALYAGTSPFWNAVESGECSPTDALARVASIEPASAPSWRKPSAAPVPHRFSYWPVSTPPDPDPIASLPASHFAPGGGPTMLGAA